MMKKRQKSKTIWYLLYTVLIVTLISCTPKNDNKSNGLEAINLNAGSIGNTDSEITVVYENNDIVPENFEETDDEIIAVSVNSEDTVKFPPETYEAALKLMNSLGIENVILEKITINNETYTVVEVRDSQLTVGIDAETVIYDIPDKSGNVLLTLPFKTQIRASVLAIIEEPSAVDFGYGTEHWVKIKMDDGTIGWVRGEYTEINRGGVKYQTPRNLWLFENYIRYYI